VDASGERLPAPDLDVRLDRDALVRGGGRTLAGGRPFRLLRLSEAGARLVRRWQDGEPVGESPAARALAGRLLDAGVLVAAPAARPPGPDAVEVVVPVRDRPDALAACLAALAGHAVTVVDDGSQDPAAVAAVADAYGARLVVLPVNRGPAGARNAGLAATTAPLVAFVDSDVRVEPGYLDGLHPHFDDPRVAIAAPRVLAARSGRGVAGYEARHSSLDMGADAGLVGPGGRVPYVPSTALLVRRGAADGFDEDLRFGEDVDLCWRVLAAGHRIVYDPRVAVRHDHRVTPGAFLRTRWAYAASIAPLARRHPDALPAVRLHPLTAGILVAATTRRAGLTALLAAVLVARLRRRVGSAPLAAELTARDVGSSALGVARAVRRAWAPVLVVVATRSRRTRTVLAAAAFARALESDHPSPRDLPLALLDDLVAATATTVACARERVATPLLPTFPPPGA
jgi:mycofactocin system glycosyltransferase